MIAEPRRKSAEKDVVRWGEFGSKSASTSVSIPMAEVCGEAILGILHQFISLLCPMDHGFRVSPECRNAYPKGSRVSYLISPGFETFTNDKLRL